MILNFHYLEKQSQILDRSEGR